LATSADFIIYKLKSIYGAGGEEKARVRRGVKKLFHTIVFLLSSQPENVK